MDHPDQDARTRAIWARTAPRYDTWMRRFDRWMLCDGRRWLCSQARGRVLEVALGTGLTLPHYPEDADLTGVDLSPDMLARARRRADDLGIGITLAEASATRLPFPDGHFDTVVCVLALCCIPDDRAAVAEMHRVLAPGGTLLLVDHVISHRFAVRLLQRALDPLMVTLADDHQLRRPFHLVREAGFTVRHRDRYSLGIIERLAAVKPAA
ncbi:class I SAM-dependent methyltransferase [Streptomyces natalensis]|uniref:Ubiquinone biosynthesis methyltransferase UbiE n=1 Tax=Streptomyces natalensis ATCC 27448 TaxID=1240678 RepID=A0A0D7CSI2_9ACTN|nr:class I SAM-dependent methyltransferase [Streptomyces natalensis]KIZ19183.1 ubiquinone biosynthesis methyltransferase UbiE [Streptomyces natalensis ATCC 27448]